MEQERALAWESWWVKAIQKKQWACSRKATDRELCECPANVWHLWGRSGSSLIRTFLWDFVEEGEVMLCQHERGKSLHRSEKAQDEGGRQAKISVAEKANEALREMNLACDSISGAWKSVAR